MVDKLFKIGMKSFLMALVCYAITFLFVMFILGAFIGSDVFMIGMGIMFSMFFCTYLIIDAIKEYSSK